MKKYIIMDIKIGRDKMYDKKLYISEDRILNFGILRGNKIFINFKEGRHMVNDFESEFESTGRAESALNILIEFLKNDEFSLNLDSLK